MIGNPINAARAMALPIPFSPSKLRLVQKADEPQPASALDLMPEGFVSATTRPAAAVGNLPSLPFSSAYVPNGEAKGQSVGSGGTANAWGLIRDE